MKLIFAIVSKDDSYDVQDALTHEKYSVTKLASSGGFLRAGNVTFLIGTQDELVDHAIEIIASKSRKRTAMVPAMDYGMNNVMSVTPNIPVQVGGATIFVVDMERFEKV